MTELYQKMLLVQNIPPIQGISEVQDLIKSFAYRGDFYMEKAKEYKKRLYSVLHDIDGIITNIKKIDYTTLLGQCIRFINSDKSLNCRFLFLSNFCPTCGDYKSTFVRTRKHTRCTYPRCKC